MSTTAIITGASAGIGRDLAALFAADGHDLILVARRVERLEALSDSLAGQFGVECRVEPCDLGDAGARVELLARIGGVAPDFLVNAAGFGSHGTFWELPVDRELTQISVNVEALVHLTRAFLPAMVARGSGRVLNIASTAGFQPGPYMATYYATKAFVLSFTEAIAAELAGSGVTATAHCPGPTATEFAAVAGKEDGPLKQASLAPSEEVARDAYAAMQRGEVVAVHGALNAAVVTGERFLPRGVVRRLVASLNKKPKR